MNMKRLGIIALILIITVFTGCKIQINGKDVISYDWSPGGDLVEKQDVLVEEVTSQKRLTVKNSSGRLDIKPWDKETIQITANKKLRAKGDKQKLDSLMEQMKVVVEKSGNEFNVYVNYFNAGWGVQQQRVDLEILVPEKIKVIDGRLTSGDITFAGFKDLDEFKLEATSGSLDARDTSAKSYKLGLTSGRLEADNIAGEGEIWATSGSLRLSKINGDIDFEATSADLELTDFEGRITSQISSGDIKLRNVYLKSDSSFRATSGEIYIEVLKIDNEGSYKLDTSSGDIRLYLPGDTGFNLNASASSGNIRSDFDVLHNGLDIDRRNRELKGVVGTGGPDIDIHVTSGEVAIRKK